MLLTTVSDGLFFIAKDNNLITGTIPETIGNLNSLTQLMLCK